MVTEAIQDNRELRRVVIVCLVGLVLWIFGDRDDMRERESEQ